MTDTNEPDIRKFWQAPWGYKEAVLICAGMLLLGLILEWVSYPAVYTMPSWPFNLGLIISILIMVLVLWLYRKSDFFRWASGAKTAIVIISFLVFMVILMGVIPQQDVQLHDNLFYKLGLNRIASSRPFIFMSILLLIVLGLVTVRRLHTFSLRNIAFFLNHAGLWLTLAAGLASSGDMRTLEMTVEENKINWVAYDAMNDKYYEMPLAIELNDFRMEEYPPRLVLIDSTSEDIIFSSDKNRMVTTSEQNSFVMGGYNISIATEIPFADGTDSMFYPMSVPGAAWAANVSARHLLSGQLYSGWISCGSYRIPPRYLLLGDGVALGMMQPSPKLFASDVTIYTKDGEKCDETIEVNKPVSVAGWKVYQNSYNRLFGRDSDVSVFKLIHDPWLPIVYTGLYMLIAGALLLFWTGKKRDIS